MQDHATVTEQDLVAALERDEFVFHYQPKVSLQSGKVDGAEALIRWQRGATLISPNDFIPLAMESGLMKRIAIAMFQKLAADMVIIQDGRPGFVMSFNLCAEDFETSEMLECIRTNLQNYRLKAEQFQVELTESSVINSSGAAREHVNALVDMGIRLAMDDYGTGYSSLDVLSQWPFSIVKIDQGLVRRMSTSEKSTTIVQASIRMAHQLGIDVVAEGIESADVYEFLLNAGCDEAQGYWMSKPMPLSEFLSFMKRDQRWSGLPVGLIHMAQLDHIQWRRSLIDQVMAIAFNGDEAGVRRVKAELDPHCCKLGIWYYGLGQEFRGIPPFDMLERPHRQLHETGQELVNAVERHAHREDIVVLLRTLTYQSGIVLGLLQELENEAMLMNVRQLPEA